MEYIYVIKSEVYKDNYYKVGMWTAALKNLRRRYVTPLGSNLEVKVFEVKNAREIEKRIQRRLEEYRVNEKNEIYNIEYSFLLDIINKICMESDQPTILSITPNRYIVKIPPSDVIERIEIWSGQRIIREERVDEIFEYHKKKYQETKQVGDFFILTACTQPNKLPNKLILIDGQHRFAAYKNLINMGIPVPGLVVYVLEVNKPEDIRETFETLNKLEPVPKLYFQTDQDKDLRGTIAVAVNELEKLYPEIFTKNRTQRPRLNNQRINEAIFEQLKDSSQVYTWNQLLQSILDYNTYLSKKDIKFFMVKRDIEATIRNMHTKAKKIGCYIGLFGNNSWVHQVKWIGSS